MKGTILINVKSTSLLKFKKFFFFFFDKIINHKDLINLYLSPDYIRREMIK